MIIFCFRDLKELLDDQDSMDVLAGVERTGRKATAECQEKLEILENLEKTVKREQMVRVEQEESASPDPKDLPVILADLVPLEILETMEVSVC